MDVDPRLVAYVADRLQQRLPDATEVQIALLVGAAWQSVEDEIDEFVTQAAIERESAEVW